MKTKPPFNEKKCLQVDPFEGDFGSPGDRMLSDKLAIARARGECHECTQDIKPGELIRRRTDITEGAIVTYRWCSLCCAAMAKSWSDHGKAWEARVAIRLGDRAAFASNPERSGPTTEPASTQDADGSAASGCSTAALGVKS